jgi:hypothetical protein
MPPVRKPFDFQPKPPYPHRPVVNQPRKPPMTVAIGMLCEDGIVLASDSKYRTNGEDEFGKKIYPLPHSDWLRVVVAGAGTVGFIKAAKDKIKSALPLAETSLLGVQAFIESVNKAFYESYIVPHPDPFQRPDYGLLIGVAHKTDGLLLLHTTANSIAQVDDIQMEGTGGVVANCYKPLWRGDMPAYEAELASIFMVRHAKIHDSKNCGGDTKVFTLLDHDILLSLEKGYIELAEKYFDRFNKLALEMVLPSETGELDQSLFQGALRAVVEDLQHYRDDLQRYHPHAYRRVT